MSWQLAVVLRVIVAHGLCQYLIKKTAIKHCRTERFLWQFFFCVLIASVFMLISGGLKVDNTFLLIVVVGFFNGLAAYFSWKAIAISLSRTSLFTFWDDIITLGLGYLILGEVKFLNPGVVVGVLMSLTAVVVFAIINYRRSSNDSTKNHLPMKFFVFVGMYSVIWGVAVFAMRYWGLSGVSLPVFGIGWYLGALISATLIFLFYKDGGQDQQAVTKLTRRDITVTLVLAILVFTALVLGYIGYRGAPITVLQPIFLSSEMIIPSLIGLFIFHERKQFEKVDWVCFGLGLAGAMTVVWSF